MRAYGDITTTSAITAATSALTVLLYSDFDDNASGTISIGAGVSSNAGTITIQGGGGVLNTTSAFDNLTIDTSGNIITLTANTIITGDLTLTAGTIDGTSDLTVNGGAVTGNGDINLTGGSTFLINTAGNFGGDTAWDFSNLTIGAAGNALTTATGSGSITVSGV